MGYTHDTGVLYVAISHRKKWEVVDKCTVVVSRQVYKCSRINVRNLGVYCRGRGPECLKPKKCVEFKCQML